MNNLSNKYLSGFFEIGKTLSHKLTITGLYDTPTGYVNASGKYLVVNDGETGVHFTGIEKIASDLIDYGFSKIPQYTDLPDVAENDGKIVASGCDLYHSCNGAWNKIGGESIPPPAEAPACVSSLEEYSQYREYINDIINSNTKNSFDAGLSEDQFDLFFHSVCLFQESNGVPSANSTSVKIQESNYKWGEFTKDTSINIAASIELPGVQCDDLVIQSNSFDGDTSIVDTSRNSYPITNSLNVEHSSNLIKYGSTSLFFNGSNWLTINDTADVSLQNEGKRTFAYLHQNTNFSISFWINGDIAGSHDSIVIANSSLLSSQTGTRVAIASSRIVFSINKIDVTNQLLSKVLNNNQWYFVEALAFENMMYLYVDGEWQNSGPYSNTNYLNVDAHHALTLGKNLNTNTSFLKDIFLQDIKITKNITSESPMTIPNSMRPVQCGEESTCSFVEWKTSDASILGDKNSANTTALITKDTAITGVFQC